MDGLLILEYVKVSLVAGLLLLVARPSDAAFTDESVACGGFVKITDPSITGFIQSPNYPGFYSDLDFCIWLLEARSNYAVKLTIIELRGEVGDVGQCKDYLEVRDGNETALLRFRECAERTTRKVIKSTNRWLWVKFLSDRKRTNGGFFATWSIIPSSANKSSSTPYSACTNLNYRCANKQCVSWAYRCDGQNDCGCTGLGCDENSCGGFDISATALSLIGISVGCVTFIVVFLGIGVLEIYLKKRAAATIAREKAELSKPHKPTRQIKARSFASISPTPSITPTPRMAASPQSNDNKLKLPSSTPDRSLSVP